MSLPAFSDFDSLVFALIECGETFTQESLSLLAYPDLPYAATSAAEGTRCHMEDVIVERERRLRPYATWISQGKFPNKKMVEHVRKLGMFADIAHRMMEHKMKALPAWGDMSPRVKLFFTITCLCFHTDDPEDRLNAVLMLESMVEPQDAADQSLMGIIRTATEQCLLELQVFHKLDLSYMRMQFKGYDFLSRHMNDWEKAIIANNHINGYHCTYGCFRLNEG